MGWIPFGSETNNRDRLRFVQLNWSTKEIPTNHRVFRWEGWDKREKPSWYSLKKNVSFFFGGGAITWLLSRWVRLGSRAMVNNLALRSSWSDGWKTKVSDKGVSRAFSRKGWEEGEELTFIDRITIDPKRGERWKSLSKTFDLITGTDEVLG